MHSRIFGIDAKENYNTAVADGYTSVTQGLYYNFEEEVPAFADYVAPVEKEDKEEDFNWLLQSFPEDLYVYEKETHTIVFLHGFKKKYFEKTFDRIKKLVNREDMFDKFCQTSGELYQLEMLVNGDDGFYVSDTDGYYTTLDNFIRCITEGEKYVIFDSVDYHH